MRNKINSMLLGLLVLISGTNASATIVFPVLEVNPTTVTGTSGGVVMSGVAPFTLSGPSTILTDFIPDLSFTLTSDAAGSGTLSVTGSDTLFASFSNLSITHTFAGIADVTADLTYTGGTLAATLGGSVGRLEGQILNVGSFAGGQSILGLGFTSNSALNTAKIGAVPVPAAVWLFGSGLLGLAGFVRRKTQA